MPQKPRRLLSLWLDLSIRHASAVLVVAAMSVAACLHFSSRHFRINSDTSRLVHQEASFRRDYRGFTRAFPGYDETTLVVLSARSRGLAAEAADRLGQVLRRRPDLVTSVYVPGGGAFFEDRALLYLDLEELDRVSDRLAEVQPVLAALAVDPSLRGLFAELGRAVLQRSRAAGLPRGLADAAARVAGVGEKLLAGEARPVSWEDELLGAPVAASFRLVIVQGREAFSDEISSEHLLSEIRSIAEREQLTPDRGVRVRLTGMVPLAYEELESARSSVRVAAAISVALLAMLMVAGVRSLRVVVATMATVGVSIAWTAAFALLTVGEFSTISLAFSVLMVGLGVDFAIHLCLRFLEGVGRGLPTGLAIQDAGMDIGAALGLCAVTSSIGFLSFVPTDYTGLAELGIISGGGMGLALLASFSVTPALLLKMGRPRGRPPVAGLSSSVSSWVSRHARGIGWGALAVGVAALALATRMTFDFSTLGTKDPHSESMTTLRELQAEGILTDYSAMVIAPDVESASAVAQQLAALDLVAEARPPQYYLPRDQHEKLEILEDIALFLGPALRAPGAVLPPDGEERLRALDRLRVRLADAASLETDDTEGAALARLRSVLDRIRADRDPEARAREFERLLVADFRERVGWLRRALGVGEVSFSDLPEDLRRRLVAPDGRALVSALPSEDVSDVHALSRFLDAIGPVASGATGRPVVEAGIGEIVVRAFAQALALAALGIVTVVVLALRSALDTLLVLAPLALSAVLTVAAGVLIDTPFNMANVIVIPLVLGLGVDNGIHLLMRFRRVGSLASALGSSTPRAVLLSGLTTLGAFGALSTSSHRGIESMGILLCIALVCLLATTLIVLPALLALRETAARNGQPGDGP